MRLLTSITVALLVTTISACNKGGTGHNSDESADEQRRQDSIASLIKQARQQGAIEGRTQAEKSHKLHTPSKDDPERKAILDALRVVVETEVSQSVMFQVDYFKVKDDWAFMLGTPKQPSGRAVDYDRSSMYRDAWREGPFEDQICALLRKKGSHWHVITHVIGATDVAYVGWWDQYNAPREIFGN